MGRAGTQKKRPVAMAPVARGAISAGGGAGLALVERPAEPGAVYFVQVSDPAVRKGKFRYVARNGSLTDSVKRAARYELLEDAHLAAEHLLTTRSGTEVVRIVDELGTVLRRERLGWESAANPLYDDHDPKPEQPIEPRFVSRERKRATPVSVPPLFDPAAHIPDVKRFQPRSAGKWWLRLERWGFAPGVDRRKASEWCQLLEAFGLMPMSTDKERTLGKRVLVALNVIPSAAERRKSRAWQVFERRFGYLPSVDAGGGYPSYSDILAGHTLDAKRGREHKGKLTRACGHQTFHTWRRPEERYRLLGKKCEECVQAEKRLKLSTLAGAFELMHGLPALQASSPVQAQEAAIARHQILNGLNKALAAHTGEEAARLAEAVAMFRERGPRDAVSWLRMAEQELTLEHVAAEYDRHHQDSEPLRPQGRQHKQPGRAESFVKRRAPRATWPTGTRRRSGNAGARP